MARTVERAAKRKSLSVSELTRRALRAYLGVSKDQPKKIPFAGLAEGSGDNVAARWDEILAEGWAEHIRKDSGLAGGR